MKKGLLIFCLLTISCFGAFSQTKSIDDAYYEYKISRNVKGSEEAVKRILVLLGRANELKPVQIANLEYHAGRMYEEMNDADHAIVHYENSLKAEPDYFVIHRALGFIYLAKTKPIVAQMNEATKVKDATANVKAFQQYKVLVKKAIPYLEKYQACDGDDETLALITNLYKSIKDTSGIATLNNRFVSLRTKCVSLLED